ncbi:heme-degrading domain-containing protein [Furfurilactobacillus milii]|uniref:heme-degrading domain-containing protein n=1 Tax=Furfurilactobacillus milii TaxID=2888272 RepID=UPI001F283256|nr:heme-degrading domain-containing protein [Furfurilactobacillus milii]MCF6418593.1 heme-degrading domain-containing protein [Furfurilactobacillus milii]
MLSIDEILKQEEAATLDHFGLKDVDRLVEKLKTIGGDEFQRVCILITKNDREVYFHAGTSTTNENNIWIEKKANVVNAYEHSSLLEKAIYADNPDNYYQSNGLSPKDYAIVGGGFPICVQGTGIVGTLIVSGLTDEGDHDLAYKSLSALKQSQK